MAQATLEEHSDIVQCMMKCDEAGARAAMERHILSVKEMYAELIAKRQPEGRGRLAPSNKGSRSPVESLFSLTRPARAEREEANSSRGS